MPPVHPHNYAAQLQAYVEAHLDEPITLAALAAAMHMSPSSYCHAFQRATGQPPMRLVRTLRLTHAQRLLRTTTASTAAIGAAVGYVWPTHFSKAFRAAFGESPQTYRHRQRLLAAVPVLPKVSALWMQVPPAVQAAVIALLEALTASAGIAGAAAPPQEAAQRVNGQRAS